MKLAQMKPTPLRLRLACLVAMSGLIVSVPMLYLGGPMVRFFPPWWVFHPAAMIGAGIAGLALADGFGRPGWRGWAYAALTWIIATVGGAMIGASLVASVADTQFGGGSLGLFALLDASERPVIVGFWALTLAGVQIAARRLRARAISP